MDKPSIALRLVNVEPEGNTVQTLAAGQPFYFSWSPDGQRLLTHIDNERVELQSVDGSQMPVAMPSGFFQAPQWSADGSHLIFGAGSDTGQRLVVADEQGNSLSEVTDFDGRITFTESPDGRQLAYVVTDAATRASTLGPLYTVEPDSLRTRELTDRPVLAFFWSPDSQKLAYLTLGEIAGRLAMRWHVWDGKRTEPYAAFFPTATFLDNYLPFFDQYTQSHNLWSPDSEAFVFAGTLADGRRGVWVQALGRDRVPTSAGPGQAAVWSLQ